MGRCISFSVVKWKESVIQKKYRALGMQPRTIKIDDSSTMHCWMQKEVLDGETIEPQKPALLLIHGFGMNGIINWEQQVPFFIKEFRVYVPDLIFFGDSHTDSAGRTESFQAECIKKMLDVLKVKKVNVLGTSYGGFVAYRFAHMFPTVADKVIIASSGVCMTPTSNSDLLRKANTTSILDVLIPTSVAGVKQTMQLATTKNVRWVPNFIFREFLENYYQDRREERIELISNMVFGSENAPPIPTLGQKVLILWGDHDQIFSPTLAHELKEFLGDNATLFMIPGAGHVPQIEFPSKFNTAVRDFLLSST